MKDLIPRFFLAAIAAAPFAVAVAAPGSSSVQQLFEQRRALEMRSHAGRIRILQEADACIRSAPDLRAYRACEEQEAAGRQALRDELRPEFEALRSEWQALRRSVSGPQ